MRALGSSRGAALGRSGRRVGEPLATRHGARPLLPAVWVALLLSACPNQDNRPPLLDFVGDQLVAIRDGLRLPLSGSDPDGDPLGFEVAGLPGDAQIVPSSATESLLYWNPLASDTEPGGRTYDLTVTVNDGRGGSASERFTLTVYSEQGAPRFELPTGVVVNLAEDDGLSLIVGVKDDDSVDVSIALIEGPEGAKLQSAGPKSSYFHWAPSAQQRDVVVHRALFGAQDETHDAVTHELTIVLLNTEDAAGCDGTPPTIKHTVPADSLLTSPATVELSAEVVDGESGISTVQIEWRLGELTAGDPIIAELSAPESGTSYVAELDLGAIDQAGQLLHYALVATDNDDATGTGCDRVTRSPKSGWHTVAVYPDTSPAGTCADDEYEPDSQLADAPLLAAGLYAGRRICGQDLDFAQVDAAPLANVTAQVVRTPAHGAMVLRLRDQEDIVVDVADGDEPTLTVAAGGSGPYTVEVEGLGPKPQLSYMLVLTAEEAPCAPDPWEPNDSVADATSGVTDGALTGSMICPGDADWFRFDLGSGETLTVSTLFEHAYGDLDAELFAADGLTLLEASNGQTSIETVSHTAVGAAQTVFLRVSGHQGVGNGYTLSVQRAESGVECDDDILAGNVAWSSAVILFQGVYQNLEACPATPDWFEMELNGGETVNLLVETAPDDDIEIRVYDDPTGAALVTVTPDANGLTWGSVVAEGGKLFYEIGTSSGAPVGYTLLQDVEDPAGPCPDDRYEPNDTEQQATTVSPGVHTWLRLCGMSDEDVFRMVDVPPFATLSVLTAHAPGQGFTDIVIVGPNGSIVADVLDLGDGAEVSILAESAGSYRVYVRPYDVGDALPYDLAILVD